MTEGAALITGASAGIGRELAEIFAREGHDVVLVARREVALKELADQLERRYRVTALPVPVDLAQPDGPAELVRRLDAAGVRVRVLVNNAGVGVHGRFVDTDLSAELAMLQLNVVALTELTKRVLPQLLEHGGRILNVSSGASFVPGPLMSVYYASKAYVTSFSQALATELAGSGVTVTTFCPGVTRSEFQSRAGIRDIPLTRGPLVMGSRPVAEAAYRAVMRGRRLSMPGLANKLMLNNVSRAFMTLLPSGLPPRVVGLMHRQRDEGSSAARTPAAG